MVCLVRIALTGPTGAMETEGALPDCATHVDASNARLQTAL
jgi:hypothetical protein